MAEYRTVDWKLLLICLLICLVAGTVSGIITGNSVSTYESLKLPDFTPPAIAFPIVWTLLYILMGVSLYLIVSRKDADIKVPVIVFAAQLLMNFCWSPIFFTYGQYLLAFVWIVLLWILVFAMIILFRRIDARAGYIQIPYLLWLIVAGYLSYSVYVLN